MSEDNPFKPYVEGESPEERPGDSWYKDKSNAQIIYEYAQRGIKVGIVQPPKLYTINTDNINNINDVRRVVEALEFVFEQRIANLLPIHLVKEVK